LLEAWHKVSRYSLVRRGTPPPALWGIKGYDCQWHRQKRQRNRRGLSANKHKYCRCSPIAISSSVYHHPRLFWRRGTRCLDLHELASHKDTWM